MGRFTDLAGGAEADDTDVGEKTPAADADEEGISESNGTKLAGTPEGDVQVRRATQMWTGKVDDQNVWDSNDLEQVVVKHLDDTLGAAGLPQQVAGVVTQVESLHNETMKLQESTMKLQESLHNERMKLQESIGQSCKMFMAYAGAISLKLKQGWTPCRSCLRWFDVVHVAAQGFGVIDAEIAAAWIGWIVWAKAKAVTAILAAEAAATAVVAAAAPPVAVVASSQQDTCDREGMAASATTTATAAVVAAGAMGAAMLLAFVAASAAAECVCPWGWRLGSRGAGAGVDRMGVTGSNMPGGSRTKRRRHVRRRWKRFMRATRGSGRMPVYTL